MDNNLIELGFALDRSGSMGARVGDVIGGFNGLLQKQRKEPGRANVTILGFDTTIVGMGSQPMHEVIADGMDIRMVPPLDEKTYFARGGTPLFDAVARLIDLIGNRLRNTPEDQRPGKVLITVMTDGQENESVEYARRSGGAARLREKIKHQQDKYAWDIVFLGANMDAVLAGGEIGLHMAKAMSWSASSEGVGATYAVMNSYVTRSRMAPSAVDALVSNSFSVEERSSAMGNNPQSVAGTIGGGILPTVDAALGTVNVPAATILGNAPPHVDTTTPPSKP